MGTGRSKYFGVIIRDRGGKSKYNMAIRINNVLTRISGFNSEIDAAIEYDNYCIKNGLIRRLNFPKEEQVSEIPNTKIIKLNKNLVTIVDEEDFDMLNQFVWTATGKNGVYYATRHIYIDGKRKSQKMHRLILGNPSSIIDHRNRNTLHNYKSNLRVCNNQENSRNSKPLKNSFSQYKGVFKSDTNKKYKSAIRVGNKTYFLGYFDDEIKAAKAYDLKAKELFGEFAYLNFPEL